MLNEPIRLMLTRAREARSAWGPSLPTTFSPWTMPAQLTRPCSPAEAVDGAATAALALASSVTSQRTKRRLAPTSRSSARPSGLLEVGGDDPPARGDEHPRGRLAEADAPPLTMKTLFPMSMIDPLVSQISARPRRDRSLRLDDAHRRRDQARDVGDVGGRITVLVPSPGCRTR